MRWRRSARLPGAVLIVIALVTPRGARAECDSVRITTDPVDLGAEWRSAVENLMAEMQRPGMPWSCAGGSALLRIEKGNHGVLQFRDAAGNQSERHVPAASALVATAEAFLARALPPEPPRETASELPDKAPRTAAAAADPPAESAAEKPEKPAALALSGAGSAAAPPPTNGIVRPHEPRYLLDASVGIRVSGPLRAVWFAPALEATVPLGAWFLGSWGRLGIPHVIDGTPEHFSMSQVSVGISGGRALLTEPVELRVVVDPSLVVVSMEGGEKGQRVDGGKIDLRVGAGLRGAIPLASAWRIIVGLDGEVSPAGLVRLRRIDDSLPALPVYDVGAAVGLELVVR